MDEGWLLLLWLTLGGLQLFGLPLAIILGLVSLLLFGRSKKTGKKNSAKVYGILSAVLFVLSLSLQGAVLY